MAKQIRESEVKNKIRKEYFNDYDWTRAIGDIDLAVCSNPAIGVAPVTYLWCETKQGTKRDIYESLIQLILTVGKARTYESEMPPYYLGAADAEKIAFVEYNKVMHIFSKTDFNWNVAPSDHGTKEFRELDALLRKELESSVTIFKYAYDDTVLRKWIKKNFKEGRSSTAKIAVGKNNFTFVYYDWVKTVKDTIAVDWPLMQKSGILDCDFFLADLMSKDGMSIKDKLKVVLEKTKYKVLVKADLGGIFGDASLEFYFKDEQRAYNQFWNRYERPPKPVYQKHILERRDLLVPQDIREIKGSYYTPEQWVRLSQEYLSKVLGEDWQEEYYVWDCAAGSGNLLRGLTNRYNVYASTLDDADVKVMHDAIDSGRLNLVKQNVFQFDFLNDGYETAADGSIVSTLATCKKIPESLRKIIEDPEKRKKLVIYINPPYAEPTNTKTKFGSGAAREGVADCLVKKVYFNLLGRTANELFALFYVRILKEIPSCFLAEFSKLKILQGPNFRDFRRIFSARLMKIFIVPSYTFDNVKGTFPIGFQIYNTGIKEEFDRIYSDVYESDGTPSEPKLICSYTGHKYVIDWFRSYYDKSGEHLCYFRFLGTDFQHNSDIFLTLKPYENDLKQVKGTWITKDNAVPSLVYFAVRRCLEKTWMNDRDQFLYPNSDWENDVEFQADCIVYSIFNVQNRISCEHGVNHWIPYYESEVGSPASFKSRFLVNLLHGKVPRVIKRNDDSFGRMFSELENREADKKILIECFSQEATDVYESGKKLWSYYMSRPGAVADAGFYDIKSFFQGYKVTDKGKRMMNSTSEDETYTALLKDLRDKMKALEAHIEPKIYEHGFLLK